MRRAEYITTTSETDPAVGRYSEPDPLGVSMGSSLYPYVRANPERMIDPLGLYDNLWPDKFRQCIQGGGRNCGAVAFASAVAEEFKPIQRACDNIDTGLRCTAHCAGEEFFGSFESFANVVYKETLFKTIEHIAETAASTWVRRGVPVIAYGFYAKDLYKIVKCTMNCVKE